MFDLETNVEDYIHFTLENNNKKEKRKKKSQIKKEVFIHTTLNHKHFATKSQNNFKKIGFPSKIENVIDTNSYETEIEFSVISV